MPDLLCKRTCNKKMIRSFNCLIARGNIYLGASRSERWAAAIVCTGQWTCTCCRDARVGRGGSTMQNGLVWAGGASAGRRDAAGGRGCADWVRVLLPRGMGWLGAAPTIGMQHGSPPSVGPVSRPAGVGLRCRA
jgi:hypothetical protein